MAGPARVPAVHARDDGALGGGAGGAAHGGRRAGAGSGHGYRPRRPRRHLPCTPPLRRHARTAGGGAQPGLPRRRERRPDFLVPDDPGSRLPRQDGPCHARRAGRGRGRPHGSGAGSRLRPGAGRRIRDTAVVEGLPGGGAPGRGAGTAREPAAVVSRPGGHRVPRRRARRPHHHCRRVPGSGGVPGAGGAGRGRAHASHCRGGRRPGRAAGTAAGGTQRPRDAPGTGAAGTRAQRRGTGDRGRHPGHLGDHRRRLGVHGHRAAPRQCGRRGAQKRVGGGRAHPDPGLRTVRRRSGAVPAGAGSAAGGAHRRPVLVRCAAQRGTGHRHRGAGAVSAVPGRRRRSAQRPAAGAGGAVTRRRAGRGGGQRRADRVPRGIGGGGDPGGAGRQPGGGGRGVPPAAVPGSGRGTGRLGRHRRGGAPAGAQLPHAGGAAGGDRVAGWPSPCCC